MINQQEILSRIVPYEGRAINLDIPVDVYHNRRTHSWSIRQKGRVVGHADKIMLRNADFIVSRSGWQRFKSGKSRRHVFAWARGYLTDSGMGINADGRPLPARIILDQNSGRFICDNLVATPFVVRRAPVVLFSETGASGAYVAV